MLTQQLPLPIGEYNTPGFENYYLIDTNREAVTAVKQHSNENNRAPLLYLWGPAGVGKTHLLLAACQAAAKQGERIAYVPLERAGTMAPGILGGLEKAALVAIDDIGYVAGSNLWEEALLGLHDLMREGPGRLLVASGDKPGALEFSLSDLHSRLSGGLVYQLEPLNDNHKQAALQLQANQRGMALSAEVADFVLRHSERDMHSLSRLLTQLERASMAAQRRLTVPFVRQVLGTLLR